MSRTILVTGASGALGPHLLAELLRDQGNERVLAVLRPNQLSERRVHDLQTAVERLLAESVGTVPSKRAKGTVPHFQGTVPASQRLALLSGDVSRRGLGLERCDPALLDRIDVVVHAAGDTRFGAPLPQLHDANVIGTGHALALAEQCPRLQQFLYLSTTFVAGARTGSIAECLSSEPPQFLNNYERTKWEAERRVAASGLPARIARLSICLGGSHEGYVHRFGAIHHSIGWLTRGLIPMLPAAPGASVDLIATDVAARWVARAASLGPEGVEVCQVAAGREAAPLPALIDAAIQHLRAHVPAWKAGQIAAPAIVDRDTFDLFARTVAESGDALFIKILGAASSFFPTLLYPKVFETTSAERVWGGALPVSDWQSTLTRVIDFGRANEWRRVVQEAAYA
jgi:nucleoside-diphosphate-sugar epimerase